MQKFVGLLRMLSGKVKRGKSDLESKVVTMEDLALTTSSYRMPEVYREFAYEEEGWIRNAYNPEIKERRPRTAENLILILDHFGLGHFILEGELDQKFLVLEMTLIKPDLL